MRPLLSKLVKEFRDGADRTSLVRVFQKLIVDGRNDFDNSWDLHEMFRRFDEFRRLYELIFPTWLGNLEQEHGTFCRT